MAGRLLPGPVLDVQPTPIYSHHLTCPTTDPRKAHRDREDNGNEGAEAGVRKVVEGQPLVSTQSGTPGCEREGPGLDQSWLAGKLGVTQSTVSAWCCGRTEPKDRAMVFDTERLLGCDPGSLSSALGYGPPM